MVAVAVSVAIAAISKHQNPPSRPPKTHLFFHLSSNLRPICPRFAECIFIFTPSDLRSKTSTYPLNAGIRGVLPVTALHITQLSDLYSTALARTFASGERIPVTFEVLEYCCSDVIIGEQILTYQNVFVEHAASIILGEISDDHGSYGLAPFDFMNSWQRTYQRIVDKTASKRVEGSILDNDYIQKQHRRNLWNYKYDFGTNASEIEQQLELARRERYKSERAAMSAQPNPAGPGAGRPPSKRRIPVVPSLPTSQSAW